MTAPASAVAWASGHRRPGARRNLRKAHEKMTDQRAEIFRGPTAAGLKVAAGGRGHGRARPVTKGLAQYRKGLGRAARRFPAAPCRCDFANTSPRRCCGNPPSSPMTGASPSSAVNFADSITTWRMRASAIVQGGALGGAPAAQGLPGLLRRSRPACRPDPERRGRLPVAVYNYLKTPQTVKLELQRSLVRAGGRNLTARSTSSRAR